MAENKYTLVKIIGNRDPEAADYTKSVDEEGRPIDDPKQTGGEEVVKVKIVEDETSRKQQGESKPSDQPENKDGLVVKDVQIINHLKSKDKDKEGYYKQIVTILKKGFGLDEFEYLKSKTKEQEIKKPEGGLFDSLFGGLLGGLGFAALRKKLNMSFIGKFINGFDKKLTVAALAGISLLKKFLPEKFTDVLTKIVKFGVGKILFLAKSIFDFSKGFSDKIAKKLTGNTDFLNKVTSGLYYMLSGMTLGFFSPEQVRNGLEKVRKILQPMFDKVFGFIEEIFSPVVKVGEWIYDKGATGVKNTVDKVKSAITKTVEIFQEIYDVADKYLISPVKKVFTAIGDGISKLLDWLETIKIVGPKIKAAREAVEKATEVAKQTAARAAEAAKQNTTKAIKWLGEKLGIISESEESASKGTSTISTGRGDAGGASYGRYQLSSKTGALDEFISQYGYAKDFEGLTPGSAEFNKKWTELSASAKFQVAERDYAKKTYYDTAASGLAKSGMDLSKRSRAVQEAIFSTSVQYGASGSQKVFKEALKGLDLSKLSDEDLIKALQAYKESTVSSWFRSSSESMQKGVASRAKREEAKLLKMLEEEGKEAKPTPKPAKTSKTEEEELIKILQDPNVSLTARMGAGQKLEEIRAAKANVQVAKVSPQLPLPTVDEKLPTNTQGMSASLGSNQVVTPTQPRVSLGQLPIVPNDPRLALINTGMV